MSFEEWKELPFVKDHFYAIEQVLRKIFEELTD